jgi:hypothetical protein
MKSLYSSCNCFLSKRYPSVWTKVEGMCTPPICWIHFLAEQIFTHFFYNFDEIPLIVTVNQHIYISTFNLKLHYSLPRQFSLNQAIFIFSLYWIAVLINHDYKIHGPWIEWNMERWNMKSWNHEMVFIKYNIA